MKIYKDENFKTLQMNNVYSSQAMWKNMLWFDIYLSIDRIIAELEINKNNHADIHNSVMSIVKLYTQMIPTCVWTCVQNRAKFERWVYAPLFFTSLR